MDEPIRHHYVPKLYLKPFIIPDTKNLVWVFDKQTKRSFKRNINDVLLQRNFYTLEDNTDKYLWEKLYSNVLEPDYAKQLNEIIEKCHTLAITTNAPIIDDQFKVDFSFSLTMQFLRTPTMRNYMTQILPGVFEGVMKDELLAHTKKSELVINALKTMNPNDERIIKDLSFKTFLFQEPLLKEFVNSFSHRDWLFCMSVKAKPFITSDNPIVTVNIINKTAGFMASSFNSQHTAFVFSLTPDICLLMLSPVFGLRGEYDRNRIFIKDEHDPWFESLRSFELQNAERLLIANDQSLFSF